MLEKDLEIKSTNKQRRKLVDYYNQWWEEKFWEKWHFKYTNRFDEVHLVSKKMWFIEWLVREDKIDLLKRTFMNLRYAEEIIAGHFSLEEKIIIILAISENPISDLISVLK